jgi:hypothetical protein
MEDNIKMGFEIVWTGFNWLKIGTMAGSISNREFLYDLSQYQLLKRPMIRVVNLLVMH